jgi:hypothetical protein
MYFALQIGIEPINHRLTAGCHHLGATGEQNTSSLNLLTATIIPGSNRPALYQNYDRYGACTSPYLTVVAQGICTITLYYCM